MAKSGQEQDHRKKGIAEILKMLQERFPEVEHVGTTRFLIWGSTQFRHRPYLEIWFDDDFLNQQTQDVLAQSQRIVSEAEAMLSNPDPTIRKQGEILASGRNGIITRRGIHIYRLDGTSTTGQPSGRMD